jgi:phospholipid/cholesterol/gamma-HCH transport system substrate-binding protein
MESKANYAFVGLFVLFALAGVLSFIVWFSNAQFDQQYDEYDVVFQGAVRGLSQGSEVRFNGLPVGEVTGLGLDATNSNAVIASIQVQADTPIHIDSTAQLEPQGLTGLNYIQISAGSEELSLMSELPGPGPFQIQGRMSQIDNLVEGGEDVILGVQRALIRVNTLLSEEAILDFQGILKNVRTITNNLEDADIDTDVLNDTLARFGKAADDVSSAAISVQRAADDFDSLIVNDAKPVLERSEVTMAELDKTLAEYRLVAKNASLVTTDLRDAINRVSNSGLTDVEETLDGIRASVDSLENILSDLERSPIGFISGTERETMEIPK